MENDKKDEVINLLFNKIENMEKEIKELKNNETRKTSKTNKTIKKDKNINSDRVKQIYFYKNPIFNYFDKYYVKFGIINNFKDKRLDSLNLYFIEDIELIDTIDIEDNKNIEIIFKDMIKQYLVNRDGLIIKNKKLKKLINDFKEIINDDIKINNYINDMENNKIEKINLEFSKIKCDNDLLEIPNELEIENFVKNTAKSSKHPQGVLICYKCSEYNYYDKNMYRFEIRPSIDENYEKSKFLYDTYFYEKDFTVEFIIDVCDKILCSLILILNLKNNKGFIKERKKFKNMVNFRQCYFICDKKTRTKIKNDITKLFINNDKLNKNIEKYIKKNDFKDKFIEKYL